MDINHFYFTRAILSNKRVLFGRKFINHISSKRVFIGKKFINHITRIKINMDQKLEYLYTPASMTLHRDSNQGQAYKRRMK